MIESNKHGWLVLAIMLAYACSIILIHCLRMIESNKHAWLALWLPFGQGAHVQEAALSEKSKASKFIQLSQQQWQQQQQEVTRTIHTDERVHTKGYPEVFTEARHPKA
eukprot:1162137-Pelagomonas_calceolata.AAC.7